MGYSELIHDFTDETLESVREPELFNVLASNEELRSEFKQQLAMKSAIRTDAKAYTPAAQSTLQIFKSLGFVPPAPIAGINSGSAGTAGATTIKSAGFFSKFGTAMITGAVAVVATGVIAYWLFNSQMDGLKNDNKNLTVALQNAGKKSDIPVVQNFAKDDVKSQSAIPEKVKIKYIYIQNPVDNGLLTKDNRQLKQSSSGNIPDDGMENGKLSTDNGEQVTDNSPLTIRNSLLFDKANVGRVGYNLDIMNGLMPMNGIGNNFELDDSFLGNVRTNLGLSFEILNMENWFDKTPTISPKEYNKFNNTSIALFYSLFEDFQIGVDYRRETFFQRFEGLDKDGKLNRYEQQPNFESAGLVFRYANKDFNLWEIYPYAQFYGGGTNVGYILRGGLGLRYSLMDYLSFVLGVNYSNLLYKYGGASWQSNRYDLNYGVSIEF